MRFAPVVFTLFVAACDATAPVDEFPPPVGVSALGQGGSIFVRWHEPNATVTKYEVEYSSDAVVWFPLKETGPTELSVTHGSVQYQQKYYYRVRACAGSRCSGWILVTATWEGGQAPSVGKPRTAGVGVSFATLVVTVDNGGLSTFVTLVVRQGDKLVYRSPTMQLDNSNGIPASRTFGVTVFGLQETTEYHVSAEGHNPAGTTFSEEVRFTTGKAGAPTVRVDSTTLGALNATTGQYNLRLFATVDPGDSPAEAWFEFARIDEPFTAASRVADFLTIPSRGIINPPVITALTSSSPFSPSNVRYKWRIVAVNQTGKSASDSVTYVIP